MGRPSTFTDQLAERFISRLSAAHGHITIACGLAKIPRRTMWDWLQRGKEGEEPFATFAASVDEIQSLAAAGHLDDLDHIAKTTNGPQSVAATQFALQALLPSTFGQKAQLEMAVTERLQQTLDGVQPLMPAESYRDLLHALAALSGHGRMAGEEASAGAGEVVDVSGEVVGETRALPSASESD